MTQPPVHREVFETRFWLRSTLLALLGVFTPLPALADVPSLLPIQGYLTDKQGTAVDGMKNVHFRLYSVATGGAPLHEEAIAVVAVNGYFTAYLGDDSTTPLDLTALRDSPKVFLGIEIATDGEAVPRLQIGSTAFAAQAQYCSDATNLGGKAPTAYANAMHTHDWSEITGKPATFPPTPGTVMCYADLMSNGYLDNNSGDDLITQSEGDARYAANVHTHDAGDITSGTLSEARYDSYSDLNGEGYLDANAGTDLLTLAQADTRYVSPMEANTIGGGMIIDGSIGPADLAPKSVTMDKTSGPMGSTYSSTTFSAAGGQYLYVSPSITMDSAGTCIISAMVRSSGTVISNQYYTYPTVEVGGATNVLCANTVTGANVCAGTYGYGVGALGSTSISATPTVMGQFDVSAGVSYRFGCFISVGTAATYYCAVSWVCN